MGDSSTIRVFINGLVFASCLDQPLGGVGRYWKELLNHLPLSIEPRLSLRPAPHARPSHPLLKLPPFHHFRPHRLSFLLEEWYSRWKTTVSPPHLVHSTYYHADLVSEAWRSQGVPSALTVFDLIHERFSPPYENQELLFAKRQSIESSSLLFCISEHTKRDLMEIYHIAPTRIAVTPLATTLTLDMASNLAPSFAKPYFLHVGNRSGYKNFPLALQAFFEIHQEQPETVLCVIGPPLSSDEFQIIHDKKLAAAIHYGGAPNDEELVRWYRDSLALLYPSRYEGFGIPILEAMACETPVISTNAASIPEVAGNAAILVNPDAPEEMAHAMRRIINDSDLRQSLIRLGRERCRQFSWDRTAQLTVQAWNKAISGDY